MNETRESLTQMSLEEFEHACEGSPDPKALVSAAVARERLLREELDLATEFAIDGAWDEVSRHVVRGMVDPHDRTLTWLDLGSCFMASDEERRHVDRAVRLLERLGALVHHPGDALLVRRIPVARQELPAATAQASRPQGRPAP